MTSTYDVAGTANDQTLGFTYNPAGQIAEVSRSNDAYAWNGHYNVDRLTSVDGLNRILNNGMTTMGYDGRGNLTSSTANGVTSSYSYNADNLMVTGPNGAVLQYDAAGRLRQILSAGAVKRFQYDGITLVAGAAGVAEQHYDQNNAVLRRHIHGPGSDEPIVSYEGGAIGAANRWYLMADEHVCAIVGIGRISQAWLDHLATW